MKKQYKQVFLDTVTQVWCRGPIRDPQSYYFPNRARKLSLSFSVVGSAVSASWAHDILTATMAKQTPADFCQTVC